MLDIGHNMSQGHAVLLEMVHRGQWAQMSGDLARICSQIPMSRTPPTAYLPQGRLSPVGTNQCSIESQSQGGTQVWALIPFLPTVSSTGPFYAGNPGALLSFLFTRETVNSQIGSPCLPPPPTDCLGPSRC